jgi:hypothetical protein
VLVPANDLDQRAAGTRVRWIASLGGPPPGLARRERVLAGRRHQHAAPKAPRQAGDATGFSHCAVSSFPKTCYRLR